MNPFSDNVIFWDSEFSSLDPYKGELLSVGMVKLTGEELYFELSFEGEVNAFVAEHVMPFLNGEKVSRDEAKRLITEFIGQGQPHLLAYVDTFDSVYLLKLFGAGDASTKNLAFNWIPVDFASMLFASGLDPESMSIGSKKQDAFCESLGINPSTYRSHHALDDARLLREVYLKLVASK